MMKIVRCSDCEQIFFVKDSNKEDWRSFEEFVCEDCLTEKVWRLQHFEEENKDGNHFK